MNTVNSNDLSLTELADRIGRAKSLVSRWAQQGRIPRKPNGRFDEAAVREALAGRLDPARSRPLAKPKTLADIAVETARNANPETPFEAGFVAGLVMASYSIGSIGALVAVDNGATVETGKAMETAMALAFMERSEELMRCLPSFKNIPEDEDLPGILYEVERFAQVDWTAVEADQGGAA